MQQPDNSNPLRILKGDREAPLTPLLDRSVGIIGYGNQGRAHARNLRDSGVTVLVHTRSGGRGEQAARDDGFQLLPLDELTSRANLLILSLPDQVQPGFWTDHLQPHVQSHHIIGFLHGFCIRYKLIQPGDDVGIVMIAPKGPGATLRQRYEAGLGIPCLMAVHQHAASPEIDTRSIALAWANGIGCARAGIIETTFAHETETDLFGEQAVLCGGMTWLMIAAFETLVEAGYPPPLAYLECCHEVKQIADLVYEHGIAAMMDAISDTAEFGAYTAGPTVVDDELRQRLRDILKQVRNGSFAAHMMSDVEQGSPQLQQQRQRLEQHAIEPAGEVIRALMRHAEQSSR